MKVILYIGLFLLCFSANAQNTDNWQELDYIPVKVNELVHDFGKVEQYAKQKVKFILLNDSIQPLIIKDVSTSCGCTTSSFTKRPIVKGKQGIVKVEYDAARVGKFTKSAFIAHSFGYKSIKLQIVGEVIPKEAKTASAESADEKVENESH